MPAGTIIRPDVAHFQHAPPQERELVERVASDVQVFENGMGRDFAEACNKRYRQYRGFRQFRDAWVSAGPNDRDAVVYDAKRDWGAHLHIPLSYRTIETMVPRSIAHRPRMLILPRNQHSEENVHSVRMLIDAQQEQIDIDLAFQAVMRSGRIYGLGVGKSYWRKEYAARRRVKRRLLKRGEFTVGRLEQECVFDDPDFDDVDVFDFMWDPFGSDVRTCGYLVHRGWLGLDGCLQRVRSDAWNTESAKHLTEEILRGTGNGQKYDEVWQDRMLASGFGTFHLSTRGEQIHEVWEWHDGHRVLTVLDRSILVQDAENPCVGRKPFQIYRPTPLQKQLVGIGDLEPLEHLQRELDTRRSQISDAVTLALCAGYAYDDGAIDDEDLVFGPASAIRVSNAKPSDAIFPLPRPEVPASAFEHERTIRADFDAVSGLSDALDPQAGGQISTATEAQLVQAALGRRIELGSRRFEIEVVRNAARCFLRLDQRMITENREPIRMPGDGMDAAQSEAEGRWKWFEVGPGQLQGEFDILPEGGSMAAKNVPQDRADAAQVLQLYSENPHIDPRKPLLYSLKKMGIEDPEAWMKQTDPPIPPGALQILQDMGVRPDLIEFAVTRSQEQDPRLPTDEGPTTEQVGQMMGAPA